jgi:Cu-processing system permease protein
VTHLLSLFRFELAAARRARTLPLFAAGFGLGSMAIAFVGLSAGGALEVQGFARTSISLLQLVIWIVPMLGLVTGALAGAECHELELIAALPVSRQSIVLARWLGWSVALGGALLVGLGLAGGVIGFLAGAADGWRYLRLIGVALCLLAATLALGLWVGVAVRTRIKALAIAVAVWFLLVVGMDLLAIFMLAVLPPGKAGWWLSLLLMADPVDTARALGLSLFHADVVAGPTGAALRRVLGGKGVWALTAALVAWTLIPLTLAGRRFARTDL